MVRRSWLWASLVAVGALGGCSKGGGEPPKVEEQKTELRKLDNIAVGAGYDRALDIDRDDCFERDSPTITPVNQWEATGFSVFKGYEVQTKIKTAFKVAVKYLDVEGRFGLGTESLVERSQESSYFVMLARFTSHVEKAGRIKDAASACRNVPSRSANGLEDFVSVCGDRFLDEKTYGGHVLIAWRHDASDWKREQAMAGNLGASAYGSTFDAEFALTNLVNQNYGQEEVFIETAGMPFPPSTVQLPAGHQGFSVQSALDYLQKVSQTNLQSFAQVIDSSMKRYAVSQIDECLGVQGRVCSMPETEWACVYDRLTELADSRDGTGDRTFLQAEFEKHKNALENALPDGRVVFSTVLQSECGAIDADNNPDVEASGPCQEERLKQFVDFYEACADASTVTLTNCRANVLGQVNTCADFMGNGCEMPMGTLPDGTKVPCTEAGLNASLNSVIGYVITPPRPQIPPGAGLKPAIVMSFNDTLPRTIPGVSTKDHLCGISGVRGALHESTVSLLPMGNDWAVAVESGIRDLDKRVTLEVTCVDKSNFMYLHGAAVSMPTFQRISVPLWNTPSQITLPFAGDTALLGWKKYLSEPQTDIAVTNPQATGFGDYIGFDAFPLETTIPFVGTWSVTGGSPSSSGTVAGELLDTTRGAPTAQAAISFPTRNTSLMSRPLAQNAFCYLTGISGAFYNTNDSVRIDASSGMTTLITSTPLEKDRNPGARAQCIFFDQP